MRNTLLLTWKIYTSIVLTTFFDNSIRFQEPLEKTAAPI